MNISNTVKTCFIDYFCSARSFGSRNRNIASSLILLVWLAVVIFVASKHELWRDEVRALTVALEPASFLELPSVLKNEGHPILWYLILRAAFWLIHTYLVLKIVSICIAFAGVVIFYRYAPFPLWQKNLFIWGVFPLYEYSVMARNYGISMLLFFLLAALYAQRKRYPLLVACVLAALSNTNVHSCILAGVLAAMWFFDDVVLSYHSLNYRRAIALICAFAIVGAGITFCIITTFPTQDTIATKVYSMKSPQVIQALWTNIKHPGMHFTKVFPLLNGPMRDILSLILIVGLLVRPHAAVSLYAGIVLLGTFFSTVFPAEFYHKGILIVFMVSLYWIVYKQTAANAKNRLGQRLGFIHKATVYVVLSGIFLAHILIAARRIDSDIYKEKSSNCAFGRFLADNPEYHDAIIIGEPDYILESLPYYAPNRIYIPREKRFGKRVSFTAASKAKMSLGELLNIARQLRDSERKPVMIAMGHLNLPDKAGYEISYPYDKVFTWSDEELSAFESETTKVADFKKAIGDENYEIYLLPETERPK